MTIDADAHVPTATYRLQLRQGVDLDRAAALVPYLAELGIGHLYLSPVFAAFPGSTHGYDVVDPNRIDPELGGREAFDRLLAALGRAGLGLLLDIVPNHMRAHAENPWWRDVLTHGVASRFASFFDLRWGDDLERRLVLPVLGDHYAEVLDRGELVCGRDEQGFVVRYHDLVAPFDPQTWPVILERAAARLDDGKALRSLSSACAALPACVAEAREARASAAGTVAAELRTLMKQPALAEAVDAVLVDLAGVPGDADSSAALHDLLDAQPWRLAYWRSGLGEINYRRFFDIADLVAVRSEDDAVFTATHALVAELLRGDVPVGLRVDHVDGLADPRGYIRRLRELGARWLVIEKILGEDEVMRGDWAADGTTGYETAAWITRSLIEPDGAAVLHAAWCARQDEPDLEEGARIAKLQVLDDAFGSIFRRLGQDLRRLTRSDRRARDVSLPELETVLRELTASLAVYRTYLGDDETSGRDRDLLAAAVLRARAHLSPEHHLALEFVDRVLRCEPDWTGDRAVEVAAFVRRWQQLTAPLAAKGVEDTLLYRWTAIGALAEVGAPLSVPTDPCGELHRGLHRRCRTQRAPLVTTATHDTKHGEDSRARLGVLSQLADAWMTCADEAAAALARTGGAVGDRDEIELLLQGFVCAWPAQGADPVSFGPRMREYATKAMREAKRRTGWLSPDVAYEASVHARIDALLAGLDTTPWGRRLAALQQQIAFYGAHDSLAQLVLKLGAPGVPDIYQGTELWDLSLVDPDNRRAVDFPARASLLAAQTQAHASDPRALIADLRGRWTDGHIKAFVTWRGLQLRRANPRAFIHADVAPLCPDDAPPDSVCALLRHGEPHAPRIIAAVARLTTRLVGAPGWPIGATWKSGVLRLPADMPRRWRDGWTGAIVHAEGGVLALAEIFADLPVALLVEE